MTASAYKSQILAEFRRFSPLIDKFSPGLPVTSCGYFDGWYLSVCWRNEKALVDFMFYSAGGSELRAYKEDDSAWLEIDEGRGEGWIERQGRREKLPPVITEERIRLAFAWLNGESENRSMILSDKQIRQLAETAQLITPFTPELVRQVDGRRIISAGCSSYGYDMRLADDGFRVFSPLHGREIDPKNFDASALVEPPSYTADDGAQYYLLPPHSYGLGVSVETFNVPRNVTGICLGKSSYARSGLLVNTTPLEAGWSGRLVIEIANLANLPLRVYINEGIGQVLFFEANEDCTVSYADRAGKYQNQTGLTYARL